MGQFFNYLILDVLWAENKALVVTLDIYPFELWSTTIREGPMPTLPCV